MIEALERCGSKGHLGCARVIYMEGINAESFVEEGKQSANKIRGALRCRDLISLKTYSKRDGSHVLWRPSYL